MIKEICNCTAVQLTLCLKKDFRWTWCALFLLLINVTANADSVSFVNGYVAVPIDTKEQKRREVALPGAHVFLVDQKKGDRIASTVSDLSGRFNLKAREAKGVYLICVEAEGFNDRCSRKEFELGGNTHRFGTFLLPLSPSNEKAAHAWGKVELRDGSTLRTFHPYMSVNSFGTVELQINGATKHKAYINNFNEYVIPEVPAGEDFEFKIVVEKEELVRRIDKQTNLQANKTYSFNFSLKNSPPELRMISALADNKPVQEVIAGKEVEIFAVAQDIDGDKIQYRWRLPDGQIEGPTDKAKLKWRAPNRKGRYEVSVLASDGRGGYARRSIAIEVGDNRTLFNGIVVNNQGKPVVDAKVDINGRLFNTNSQGRLNAKVPTKDRYVFTIRKDGVTTNDSDAYGTASFIYQNAVLDGRWVLRRAQVFTVDPTKAIVLRQSAKFRDCEAPRSSQIDWERFNSPRVFDWQDGRGRSLSISDIAAGSKENIERIMPILNEIDPILLKAFREALRPDREGNSDGGKFDRASKFGKLGKAQEFNKENIAKLTANHKLNKTNGIELSQLKKTPKLNRFDNAFLNRDNKADTRCGPGIKVEIPANSLVDQSNGDLPSGKLRIALSSIEVNASQMPGDWSARDEGGVETSMESFGAGSIEIGDGFRRFNLAPGKEAVLSIPIDNSQIAGGASLKQVIPFLFFNEATGIWEQEGNATLVGAGASAMYQKKVPHFSNVNADILKQGESCVAIEYDVAAGFVAPLDIEITMQPSVVNPAVNQVRTVTRTDLDTFAIYNLPNNSDIAITPIIDGVQPDGSVGPVPAGVFIVNTGGPQTSASNNPTANPDGTYYSEAGGVATGPCGSRVVLSNLPAPDPASGFEFLQGLFFQHSSNFTELNASDPGLADEIVAGALDYYEHVDPRDKRNSFNLFLSENDFGEPFDVDELEWNGVFSNSGDLGFGRDMHCRRNNGDDGAFDYACYVTNYGQPPLDLPDQVDADNAHAGLNPDATVAMEYSRVENPAGDAVEFPDNERAVKFFVYNTNAPDAGPITKADLDNFGERPVPQLCVTCHGGQTTPIAVDIANPSGPTKGAFEDRADIIAMGSSFLPFDLSLYNFPAANSKASQQASFKGLNEDIVKGVATATDAAGGTGAEIIDLINEFYAGGVADQVDEPVVVGWDKANPSSDVNRFYREVFAPSCRTCHIAQPYTAPAYPTEADFVADIVKIQSRVCNQKVMPHAKRTHQIFWNSLNPNMPAFLQLYGQTKPGWLSSPNSQCGQFYQAGTSVVSTYVTEIQPILETRCASCHSAVGIASGTSFIVSSIADTYNGLISNALVTPFNLGASPMFQRLNGVGGSLMPLGGPDLETTDEDGDGISDQDEIENWISSGAPAP